MIKIWLSKDREEAESAWETIAENLGLTYQNSDYSGIFGSWEEHEVDISVFKENQSRVARVFTGFEVRHDRIFDTSFEVGRQKLIQNLLGMAGQKDIQIGDSTFDEVALIKGWDESAVRDLLQDDRLRSACLRILVSPRYADVRITNEKVWVSVSGIVMDTLAFASILEDLLRVVRLFDETAERDSPPLALEDKNEPVIEITPEEVVEEPELVEEEQSIRVEIPEPKFDPLSLPAVAAALIEGKSFAEAYEGETIRWECQVDHIVPAEDFGWVATCRAGEGNGITIKYGIGRERKEAFDQKRRREMTVEGALVNFDPESRVLMIESGDAKEKANSYSATVVVSV